MHTAINLVTYRNGDKPAAWPSCKAEGMRGVIRRIGCADDK